ncbi:MAG: hypothetical protein ACE5KE_15700, partial [Methanosarcinales archaeon]
MADINLIVNIINIVLGIAIVIISIFFSLADLKKWIGLVVLLFLQEILLFMEYWNQISLELSRTILIIAIIYAILYITRPLVKEKKESEKKKEREIFQHTKKNLTA